MCAGSAGGPTPPTGALRTGRAWPAILVTTMPRQFPANTAISSSPAGPRIPPATRAFPASPDLPALERAVLGWWREDREFARSLEQTAGRPRWEFYHGPPPAHGMARGHH